MSIQVSEFRHIPGKNDAEYIKLLKEALERQKQITSKAIAKIKELSISSESPNNWIPCTPKKLPKYEMDVLLQFTNNMCVGFFHPSESWIIWSGGDWCTGVLEGDEEPIAWMPLPEPYGGVNNEVD